MSSPSFIQGNTIPLQISTNGSTWKNIVCSQAHEITVDNAISKEDTDCGPAVGLATPSWSATFQGVIHPTPSSPTEVSAGDLLDYANNQTQVYIKTAIASKTVTAQGYISNYAVQKGTAAVMKFTFTFTASGLATVA